MSAAANLPKSAKSTPGCRITAALTCRRAGASAPFGHELCDLSRRRSRPHAHTCRIAAFAAFQLERPRAAELRRREREQPADGSRSEPDRRHVGFIPRDDLLARARVEDTTLATSTARLTRARTRTRHARMRVTSGRKSLYLDYGNRPPE